MWIVIPKWDEFQHRDMARSSVPPWIKTYTKLMGDDDFLDLSFHLRGILVSLWLEYAAARRQLRGSPSRLSRRLGKRITARDIESLYHAGFIGFSASKPASNVDSEDASLEVEVEVEKNEDEAKASPSQALAVVTPLPIVGAQSLIAHFVDESARLGGKAPERVKGQVAREVGILLKEGFEPATIRAGLDLLLEKRLHPSTLASVVHEASLPRRATSRPGRVTPTDIMKHAQQLREQEEAMFNDAG